MAERGPARLSRRELVKSGAAPLLVPHGSSALDLPAVPRNRQLILRGGGEAGRFVNPGIWNGYAAGADERTGLALLHEPMAFYSALTDMYDLWLSEGWGYNADSTGLQIFVRSGVTWSDGTPFTAADVAFTINALRDAGPAVAASAYFAPFVEEAVASSDTEVLVGFKIPTPRFMFTAFLYRFDEGFPILPKHIFEGQDLATFANFDPARGLPVTTGPWQVVQATADEIVLDRRDSWWAAEQGLVNGLPAVERIVFLPEGDEDQTAEQLAGDEIDSSTDLRPQTIAAVMARNPKVTSFTGSRPPYGSVSRGPISLYLNCGNDPYYEPAVRWALSTFIDRQQLVDTALDGAGTVAAVPMPPFAGLKPYIDGVADLFQQPPTPGFAPDQGAGLLTTVGWTTENRIWTKNGKPLTVPIAGTAAMADIGQAVADQLKAQGVDASFEVAPDLATRLQAGDYDAALSGHDGSINGDPYYTAALYQAESVAVPDGRPVNITGWLDYAYDALVEEMALTPIDHEPQADPEKLLDLWQQAMAIWSPALPAIPLLEAYDRVPLNQTYWSGWPSSGDPSTPPAFWHRTFQLVLNRLRAAR